MKTPTIILPGIVLLGWLSGVSLGRAQVPLTLSYQGRLQAEGTNFTGEGLFKFALISPGVNTNRAASARASVKDDYVSAIEVLDGGTGYRTAPRVAIIDLFGGGSGAAALATVSRGSVVSITVTDGGKGYNVLRPPMVRLDAPPPGFAYTTYWSHDDTSVNGSEPDSAVTVPVADGLFTVLLGDTTMANMSPVPLDVFSNPSVHLRLWFSDSAAGFRLLSPDQPLASVGYAMRAAQVPDGAVTSASIAPGSVGSAALAEDVDLGDTNTLGRLDVYRTAAGTAAISLVGASSSITTYGSDGQAQVAISGTSYGDIRLHNNLANNEEAVRLTANGSSGGYLRLHNSNGVSRAWLSGGNGGGTLTLYQADDDYGVYLDGDDGGAGLITICNTNGYARLSLDAQDANGGAEVSMDDATGTETIEMLAQSSSTTGAKITMKQDNGATGLVLDAEYGADGEGAGIDLYSGAGGVGLRLEGDVNDAGRVQVFNESGVEAINLHGEYAGLVEVNTTNGVSRIAMYGHSTGGGGKVVVKDTTGTETVEILGAESSTAGARVRLKKANGTTTITFDAEDASGEGRVTTQVLEITGGSDLSEQFDVEPAGGVPQPGMLVCIDPDRPGLLAVSTQPYDRTVVGVISGAGGVKPGMLMGQQGSLAHGRHPVALTGRAYCRVDADLGAIRPGDLITTSTTPGHGMKVIDHARAQGAIIGKAMTRLDQGRGLVLVLVALQ